jgi:ribonuclease Z
MRPERRFMSKQESIPGDHDIRLTLLGTGGPPPVMERFGPSILVEAGGEKLLFDAGRGAIQRLLQLQPPVREVRSVFLTHLHSDHIIGLPDLWLTGWLNGRPDKPLKIWGPRGTREMMRYLDLAFQFDIRIRLFDDRLPPQGVVVHAEDIEEGPVYENNGVRVTAFEVDHAPVSPAFGYRIEYAGKSAVICGDTRFSEHLISHAAGTDVLVYEVIVPDMLRVPGQENSEAMQRVIEHHTVPEKAGEVFMRVNPGLAVYSHIIPVTAAAEDIIPATRTTYSGPLEVGEDLMVISIGEDVTVNRIMK